jgi:hypothetical protein
MPLTCYRINNDMLTYDLDRTVTPYHILYQAHCILISEDSVQCSLHSDNLGHHIVCSLAF